MLHVLYNAHICYIFGHVHVQRSVGCAANDSNPPLSPFQGVYKDQDSCVFRLSIVVPSKRRKKKEKDLAAAAFHLTRGGEERDRSYFHGSAEVSEEPICLIHSSSSTLLHTNPVRTSGASGYFFFYKKKKFNKSGCRLIFITDRIGYNQPGL